MTHQSLFVEGDVVAVSYNQFQSFNIGQVKSVLGNGVRVVMNGAASKAEKRGVAIQASMVRFAYADGQGGWSVERHRRAPEVQKPEPMPEKQPTPVPAVEDAPSGPGVKTLQALRDRGVSLDELFKALVELKGIEDREREAEKIALIEREVEAAEMAVETATENHRHATLLLAEAAKELADKQRALDIARNKLKAASGPKAG
jgi:hypothetical protein